MRQRRILVGGLPYFGRMLAGLLSDDGWECSYLPSPGAKPGAWVTTLAAIGRANLIYLLGGQIERWSRPHLLATATRKPIVMHWVGSDVTYALAAARRGRAAAHLLRGPIHWAEAPWTAAELVPLGISAAIVPLTSTSFPPEPPPMPADFTVLTYLPDSRREFYRCEMILRLASQLPHVQFLITGTGGQGLRAPANVAFLGWQADMAPIYRRSSVLVRLPEHDGLSFMVLEALAAGRYAIWNHPLGGVDEAKDEQAALRHLQRLLALHGAGNLPVNSAGRREVETRYEPDAVRREILGRFEALVSGIRS